MILFFKLIIWNIDIHTCLLDSSFLCPYLQVRNIKWTKKDNSVYISGREEINYTNEDNKNLKYVLYFFSCFLWKVYSDKKKLLEYWFVFII